MQTSPVGADTCSPGVAEMMHFAPDVGGLCENGVNEQEGAKGSFQAQLVYVNMKIIMLSLCRMAASQV